MLNFKVIITSGLIATLIGSVVGYGAGQVALRQQSSQVLTYYSQRYQTLYNDQFVWIGAIAGFILGASQCLVLQMKEEQEIEHGKVKSPNVLSREDKWL